MRLATILADDELYYEDHDDIPFGPAWEDTHWRILRCDGCMERFYQTTSKNSDDFHEREEPDGSKTKVYKETITYWPPKTSRKRPDWMKGQWTEHERLRKLTDEMYSAFANELPVLAAIGMRTVFDAATEIIGIDPGANFAQKLDAMLAAGKISREEREHLTALIDAGSAAAHRGWEPMDYHLDTMAIILEGFLHRAFIVPRKARLLRALPPRPERK
jgi:Domain of unknown function (DUF4145)